MLQPLCLWENLKKFKKFKLSVYRFDKCLSPVVLSFYSSIPFKISKIFLCLFSKSLLDLLTKTNFPLLNIILLLRTGVASILFHVPFVILVILAKLEDGWKLDWMNIVAKLKMKRFILHPLHLIVGFTIIVLFYKGLYSIFSHFHFSFEFLWSFLHFKKL